jgi:NSS family neurotransmitter:Na+ symporter
VFLIALWMMAYLSSLAAFQVVIGTMVDEFDVPLGRAVVGVGIAEAALTVPIAIWPSSIGVLDLIFGSGMQVLGSAIAVAGLAWGLGRATALHQVFRRTDGLWPRLYYPWVKWVVPAALIATLVLFVVDSF